MKKVAPQPDDDEELEYERLEKIEEKSTIYPLRIAFSFLSAATVFSFVATLVYLQARMSMQTYIASLSTVINLVAAYHYHEMIKLRTAEDLTSVTEWKIGLLRHSDWAVTMPLLVLKLYAIINNSEQDLILVSVDLSALLACIMVLLGAYVRLGLDELAGWKFLTDLQKLLGLLCYAGSWIILVLLLIDLCNAYSGVDNTAIVYAFFLVWPCYGVTACMSALGRRRSSKFYPKNIALVKDVVYSGLDVFSKAVFAWYTNSAAFGVPVLGS